MTTPKTLTDAALLFRRSVVEGRRDPWPAYVLPAMPPLLMVLVFTALFERIAESPAFGPGAYVDYLLPGAVVLTALLGAGFTATYLVQDAVGGYLDRLRLLPTSRVALLGGRQAFEAMRVLPAALVVTAACVALGAPVDGGIAGLAAWRCSPPRSPACSTSPGSRLAIPRRRSRSSPSASSSAWSAPRSCPPRLLRRASPRSRA